MRCLMREGALTFQQGSIGRMQDALLFLKLHERGCQAEAQIDDQQIDKGNCANEPVVGTLILRVEAEILDVRIVQAPPGDEIAPRIEVNPFVIKLKAGKAGKTGK